MSLSALVNCAVSPPDAEVCVELPSRDAFCSYTLSEKERVISKDDWQTMTPGRFSMSAEEFAKYQAFVDEVCIRFSCTVEQKKTLERLKFIFKKLESYDAI